MTTRAFWLFEAWAAARALAEQGNVANAMHAADVGEPVAAVQSDKGMKSDVIKTVRRDTLQGGRVTITPTRKPRVRFIDQITGVFLNGQRPRPATLKTKRGVNSERATVAVVDRRQVPAHPLFQGAPREVVPVQRTFA